MEKQKILIVEDDDFLLKMYITKFNIEGFDVSSAATGTEALKHAKKDKPALILLDLNLPEMSGFEVLQKIKEDDDIKDISVIILTNYSQKEDIDKCLAMGADDYLIKAHFVPSEVITKAKRILNK